MIHVIILVPLVRLDRKLIRARFADELHQVTCVEFALDEFAREMIQQGRVARRISGADVVERFDDASPGEITPEAVRVA